MSGTRIPDVCATPSGRPCTHHYPINTGGVASSTHENHSSGPGTSYGGNGAPGQPRPIDAVIERANNPIQVKETNAEPALSAADEIIKKSLEANSNTESTLTTLNAFKMAAVVALGIALLPEEVVAGSIAGASAIFTALIIGPIGEGMSIELLANQAFMQAATRAGAVLGAGKYLNILGVFKTEVRVEAQTLAAHPCEGMTAAQIAQKAKDLGLETPRDSWIMWSGFGRGNAGVKLSEEFAAKNGGMTLEMTPGGRWLNNMDLYGRNSPVSREVADDIWEEVSLHTARLASGQVRAVVGQVMPRSIYMSELKELASNPNVLGVEVLQIKPRIIFKMR